MHIATQCSIAAILFFSGGAVAQQPDPNLAAVLRDWDKAAAAVKDLACTVTHDTLDKSLGAKTSSKGFLLIAKDGNRSRFNLETTGIDRSLAERHIATNTHLYEYIPAAQTVRIHALPMRDFKAAPFFAFVTDKQKSQARYEIKLVVPSPPDPQYHYLLIRPKNAADQAEFREARITLARSSHLPRQIWMLLANGNEVAWNFTVMKINSDLPAKVFRDPDVRGWRVERVPPIVVGK